MLKSGKLHHWLYRLVRISIGSVFIYSGAVKLIDLKGFAGLVSQYDLVPDILLVPVAFGLPVLELLAGAGLVFGMGGSLSAIFIMLLLFIAVLWYGVLSGLEIDCGCFSQAEINGQQSLREALYRDFIMLAACLYLYLYRYLKIRGGQNSALWLRIRKII